MQQKFNPAVGDEKPKTRRPVAAHGAGRSAIPGLINY
jgi:hypothetical protein